MQAFKLYWKIFAHGSAPVCLIFIIIFATISIFVSTSGGNGQIDFVTYECNTAVIDNDDSELSRQLTEYVKTHSKFVEVDDTDEAKRDALFARFAKLIITIPEGFGEKFGTDEALTLGTMQLPDVASAAFMTQLVENYLTTAEIYQKGVGEIDYDAINKDLAISTEIKLSENNVVSDTPLVIFSNWLVYSFIGILAFCVAFTMTSVRKLDVKRRNDCAPISSTSFSLQLLVGNVLFGIGMYIIFMIMEIVMFTDTFFTVQGAMLALNAFVFLLVSLALSFMLSYLVTPKTIYAVANVLSLFTCFFGGVFVSQDMMSDTVKNIAVINPGFWFVKCNELIQRTSDYSVSNASEIYRIFGIELLFMAAFVVITLVIVRLKRKS